MKLVLATRNADKIREINLALQDLALEILSLSDYPDVPEVVEDGITFKENALKKARSVCGYTKEAALSDDSGLMVDALGGAPGVLSSRFAGQAATYADNNKKLLSLLDRVPSTRRAAVFVCVAVLCLPGGRLKIFRGTCKGVIASEPRGVSGFGYDPLFIVPEYGKTFAELGEAVKNKISHRAIALGKAKRYLTKILRAE